MNTKISSSRQIYPFSFFSLCAPEPDPQLFEEEYERNWEQNEDLGINDMITENYENDATAVYVILPIDIL